MRKEINMKLNDLINEVNAEQELLQACDKLCNELTEANMHNGNIVKKS